MFTVPEVLFAGAGGHVSALAGLLVFMLVPVVAIFAVAQKAAGFGADGNPLKWMAPALAGLGGAALLIPFDWPASIAGRIWLGAMVGSVVLAGAAAVWMHRLLQGVGLVRAAAVVFGATGLIAAAFCWVDWTAVPGWTWSAVAAEAGRCAGIEIPTLLLTVWLLREMPPVGFSARLLLVPLVTILESYLMTRSALSWTTVLGVVLMAGGGAGLVMAKDDTPRNLI